MIASTDEAGRGLSLRLGLPLAAFALLGGCVAPRGDAPPVTGVRPIAAAGLEAVMGATASALVAEFGRPDLDLREGPTRKLQFLGPVCILDTYLIPARRGAEPVVVHVDARLPDGREMDRASCAAALRARRAER